MKICENGIYSNFAFVFVQSFWTLEVIVMTGSTVLFQSYIDGCFLFHFLWSISIVATKRHLPAASLSSSSLICALAASLCSGCLSLSAMTVARDMGSSNSRGRSPTLPFSVTLPCSSSDWKQESQMDSMNIEKSIQPRKHGFDSLRNLIGTCYHYKNILLRHWLCFTK